MVYTKGLLLIGKGIRLHFNKQTKGNKMINHPYKVGQAAAQIERKKRAESRQAALAAGILFLIFTIVSNMEYTDCIKYGVC